MHILQWLLHEFWLTGQEIKHEITIPHTITGLIGYAILHGIYAIIHHEELALIKQLNKLRHSMAMLHVKKRHKGRFSHCNEWRVIERHYLSQ
jgi:uncharacterized membrane protein YadS